MAKKFFTINWTLPALEALLQVTEYIRADNSDAARRFGKQVKEKVGRLARFPYSGRTVPEFPGSGLRELIYWDHRIIYRVIEPKKVEILAVFHGARSMERIQLSISEKQEN